MSRNIRIITGIGIFVLLSLLGFLRDRYLIDMKSTSRSLVQGRDGEEKYRMPVSIDDISSSISGNPKWVSSVAYSFLYMALSTLCIGLIFGRKSQLYITIGIHVVIILFAASIVLTGLLFHSFHRGYQTAEYLKNLIQSPLLTLILIAGFLLKVERE